MSLSALFGPASDYAPWLVLIVAGFLPSEIWRWAAAIFARRLDENSPALRFVRYVAIGLVAGVIARLVLMAPGALGAVPVGWRIGALATGLLVLKLAPTRMFVAVAAGEALLIGAAALTLGR
jgi:hypothetical protein